MKIIKFGTSCWCAVIFMCLALNGCNSGGTSTSTTTSTINNTYTLPNGVTVLPDGAQISVLNQVILTMPGKTAFTKLRVKGGNSSNTMTLSSEITDGHGNALTSSNSGLAITFDQDTISTGLILSTSKITIDATNAVPGNYIINIIADNISGKNNTNTVANKLSSVSHNTNSADSYAAASDDSATVATLDVSVASSNMVKATYLDVTDTSTLGFITSSGYAASNIILFAFADVTTNQINESFVPIMQTAITDNDSASTIYFLSLGGALNADSSTFNTTTAPTIINNVVAQINAYNEQLVGGQITGVDLDMENNITESTITMLARGFKENGLLVSTAPQVVPLTGTTVDPDNPNNLGLSSGGYNNQYGEAVANGYVNYVLAQTYNTGGWTVGGFSESDVEFFTTISHALDNTVQPGCNDITNLCITQGTLIAIGEVSNGGSAGTIYNIFDSNGSTYYNQAAILGQLESQIDPVLSSYTNIDGVMQWSYNGDYSPTSWGDNYATPGAFTSTIFGAESVAPIPQFILQVTNTATTSGAYPYGSATLVVNGQYLVYGMSTNYPISPSYLTSNNYQQWGTSTSSTNSSGTVAYSSNFNSLFSNGATSFTATQVIINAYPASTTPLSTPSGQYNCPVGANYIFQSGYKYNVMVNPVYQSCDISQIGTI